MWCKMCFESITSTFKYWEIFLETLDFWLFFKLWRAGMDELRGNVYFSPEVCSLDYSLPCIPSSLATVITTHLKRPVKLSEEGSYFSTICSPNAIRLVTFSLPPTKLPAHGSQCDTYWYETLAHHSCLSCTNNKSSWEIFCRKESDMLDEDTFLAAIPSWGSKWDTSQRTDCEREANTSRDGRCGDCVYSQSVWERSHVLSIVLTGRKISVFICLCFVVSG